MKRRFAAKLMIVLTALLMLTGCMQSGRIFPEKEAQVPPMPEGVTLDENGVPLLKVYNLSEDLNVQMDVETYVEGVLAGEMRNDWPEEALKAQAILARTFVMKFISTKDSAYPSVDISTDVKEAQAYAPKLVNERVRAAVEATRGQVLAYEGELVNAWFHAHAGGVTELPVAGLDYKENPPYLESVESPDSEDAPQSVQSWTAEFTTEEVEKAAKDAGVGTGKVETVEIGQKGESGRAITFFINGKSVSAPAFRIQIGADQLKSTLIEEIRVEEGKVIFAGRGYGHGVGMSQWGAYGMAKEGKTAEEIIGHYFKRADIVEMW